jgi:hypothetical protein
VKTGYEFKGWSNNGADQTAEFSWDGTAFTPASFQITQTTTLTAVWVQLDKGAYNALVAELEGNFGTDAADIHYMNYPVAAGTPPAPGPTVTNLQSVLASTKTAMTNAATQAQIDAAYKELSDAYAALVPHHPVVSHSHDAAYPGGESGTGGANAVTARGEVVEIGFKGEFGDVAGFKLNGQAIYTLTPTPLQADSLDIHEPGVGVIGTITKGSAIVMLSADLVNRLENTPTGRPHKIELTFQQGTLGTHRGVATANIVVQRPAAGEPGTGQPGQGAPGMGQPGSGAPGSGTSAGPNISAPRTADDTNPVPWVILAAVALNILLITLRRRRKQTQK